MQTIEDEKKELLEWFSKNPDIGRDRTELATARFMKPDQISAENWSALYDVRKKLDVVDMDSFYMVQCYDYLRDHPGARKGSEGKFLSDMYKHICKGEELSFNQKSGLRRAVFRSMSEQEREKATARREEAELRFGEGKKKRKFIPDNIPENVLDTVILLAEFLGENADALTKFVESKRPRTVESDITVSDLV